MFLGLSSLNQHVVPLIGALVVLTVLILWVLRSLQHKKQLLSQIETEANVKSNDNANSSGAVDFGRISKEELVEKLEAEVLTLFTNKPKLAANCILEAMKTARLGYAALVMLALGQDAGAKVISLLDAKSTQELCNAMLKLQSVKNETYCEALEYMYSISKVKANLGLDNSDYVKELVTKGLSEQKANAMLEKLFFSRDDTGLEYLNWMDATLIHSLIKNSSKAVKLAALSFIKAEHASKVLACFNAKEQAQLLMALARIESVDVAANAKLTKVIHEYVAQGKPLQLKDLDNIKHAANIINNFDIEQEDSLLDNLTTADASLVETLQAISFEFEDLVSLDDKAVQLILREINSNDLIKALRGAEPQIHEKIYLNMSKRAANLIKEDLEVIGAISLSEIEQAQAKIIQAAKRLQDTGKIELKEV